MANPSHNKKTAAIVSSCIILSVLFIFLGSKKNKSGGCGARSLYSVSLKLGSKFKEYEINKLFGNNYYWCNIQMVSECAEKCNFETDIKKIDIVKLRNEHPLGVLHIDGSHFVGLVGYDSQTIHIAETGYEGPPRIERWSDGDLMARWDGVILVISKPKDGTIPPVTAQKAAPKTTAAR
ncbi:cysteine peptidase family C39 domain-containing protein [Armatimonas sp.]|uniref:cysteine peptidase family C39 domain-containing protein n=1 Tax=Armatimonas sp. TaxID=1872638 RepID=UPI00375104A4